MTYMAECQTTRKNTQVISVERARLQRIALPFTSKRALPKLVEILDCFPGSGIFSLTQQCLCLSEGFDQTRPN